jgi:hypothetical protein
MLTWSSSRSTDPNPKCPQRAHARRVQADGTLSDRALCGMRRAWQAGEASGPRCRRCFDIAAVGELRR